MPLRIHALDVGVVVLSLCAVAGLLRVVDADGAADDEAAAGANGCALLATDGCAGNGTDRGADGRTGGGGLTAALLCRGASGLFECVATATGFVGAEVIKAAAASGQHHDAGAVGALARGKQQGGDKADAGFHGRKFRASAWRHADPAGRALLDLRVIGAGLLAVVPVVAGIGRGLLDIHRRLRRRHDDDARRVTTRGRVIVVGAEARPRGRRARRWTPTLVRPREWWPPSAGAGRAAASSTAARIESRVSRRVSIASAFGSVSFPLNAVPRPALAINL